MEPALAFAQPDLFGEPLSILADGREMARALAEGTADESAQLSLARGFCAKLIEAYWSRIQGESEGGSALRPSPPAIGTTGLTRLSQSLAEELGFAAAPLSPERAFYEMGRIYNAMIPPMFRARHGVYYTPPELAEHLLDQATAAGVDWASCRVLDPACGGGAFLAPVARRMLAALQGALPAVVLARLKARIRGFEIDPFAAWLSLVAIDSVLLEWGYAAGQVLRDCVEVCDALARPDPLPGRDVHWDLVIGNPPYGRIGLTPEQRTRFRRGLHGHANLYGVFTDLALRHTRPGGIVALVTPTSFLAGNYFKSLRGLLAAEAPPVSLDFVDTRKGVFDDVLQETLLAIYRKDSAQRWAQAVTLSRQGNGCLLASPAGRFALPANPSDPWLVPRTPAQTTLLSTAANLPARLRDWGYTVSTGPLVWNRHKPQLSAKPCPGCLPLIWAEAVTGDGHFLFRAAKRNHLPWFRIRDRRDEWLIVQTPCVLVQRTTAKEQARRLIAAELPGQFLADHGGAVVENHLNMVRSVRDDPAVSAAVLAAFLNSSAADGVFRCISGSVAVSAFELEALPLPPAEALGRLETLVRNSAAAGAIEAECARLYGMAQQ